MLERITTFFRTKMQPPGGPDAGGGSRDPRLAACALLLELAYADDQFAPEEREHLLEALKRQYGLDSEDAEVLLLSADWQRRLEGDVGPFARLIVEHYTLDQKMVLAEAMWGLVRADGVLAPREERLMNRISTLLGLEPGYLAQARERWVEGGATERFD